MAASSRLIGHLGVRINPTRIRSQPATPPSRGPSINYQPRLYVRPRHVHRIASLLVDRREVNESLLLAWTSELDQSLNLRLLIAAGETDNVIPLHLEKTNVCLPLAEHGGIVEPALVRVEI